MKFVKFLKTIFNTTPLVDFLSIANPKLAELEARLLNPPSSPFKRQIYKMVKHTQTIRRLLSTNCLSVFDHFVGLVLKGLKNGLIFRNCNRKRHLCLHTGLPKMKVNNLDDFYATNHSFIARFSGKCGKYFVCLHNSCQSW